MACPEQSDQRRSHEKTAPSLPCRAPEVWKGHGVYHSSDIWSVGVMLAHWLPQAQIFGAPDKMTDGLIEVKDPASGRAFGIVQ
ncbi:hypothetical protein F4782DRAFT_534674 [Xylaria castorea]|nr:hypothetical protein F4782DRAFT_534674 [Xylaria castorea]